MCMKAGGGTVQKVIKLGQVLSAQSNLTAKYVILNAELNTGTEPKEIYCIPCARNNPYGRDNRRNASEPYFRKSGPDYRPV